MYALLLPSAQRFISAVSENVKVDERTIGVATGPPTPWFDSPAWIARVASPHWAPAADFVFFMNSDCRHFAFS
jgi:hypothetical protein